MTVDVEQIATLVAAVVDHSVPAVSRVPGSVANQDFVVTLADARQVVVKAGPTAEVAAESWALRRLAEIAVPVPHVIAADEGTRAGFPYRILTFVEGRASCCTTTSSRATRSGSPTAGQRA